MLGQINIVALGTTFSPVRDIRAARTDPPSLGLPSIQWIRELSHPIDGGREGGISNKKKRPKSSVPVKIHDRAKLLVFSLDVACSLA